MVNEDVVRALYLAMLGYEADPEGLANWTAVESLDAVIAGLAATDRYRERYAALAGSAPDHGSRDDLARAAWRLEMGAGLVELSDLPPTVAAHAAFEVLPWTELCAGLDAPEVRVIGRYAVELASELSARAPSVSVRAGWGRGDDPRCDVLVLTRGGDLEGLAWARPDLIRGVAHRLVLPVQYEATPYPDEREGLRSGVRRALHELGFMQVRHVFRRRFSGEVVDLGTTCTTPRPGTLLSTSGGSQPGVTPTSTWFVADRIAAEADR